MGQAEFSSAELTIDNSYRLAGQLPAQALANATADLAALGVRNDAGFVDTRGGRWGNLLLAEPLLPGRGVGNGLSWANLGRGVPKNDAELSNAASQAFRGFLQANSHPLRIDLYELADPGKVAVHQNGAVIQIYLPRVYEGVPVRGSHLTATINHGNLILFGTEHWGDINTNTEPGISQDAASLAVQAYAEPYPVNGAWGKTELLLVPVAKGQNVNSVKVGEGFDYVLAWAVRPAFDGDLRHFEALVDAQTGQLLSFEDTNQYAEVKGGVFPVTNDGIIPDGVEQAGWPMPYQDTTLGTTDTGGNVAGSGSFTATFFGPYVNINDNCGADSLTQTDNIDWGTSGGTDCTTPGFGGAGNTHSSRTGFYELNKIIEMGRGQLPSNSWLQARLTSNMNINSNCNAFWNGTVNFYTSGGGCANTGEIAGVFDHEWGHGMDANDVNGGIASPSGEGIADIYTALRLNDSCIGRNFRLGTNCSGNGDACTACDGVRDIDYLKRVSGNPHDYSWSNANCGGSVHCVGGVYSEAVWSLWKRNLQDPPYSYDNNTAHEIVTRLTFIGAGATSTWFSGSPPNGGCAATSGYMNYLSADDDDGDLTNGTPHMQAIFDAFDDQEIACRTPEIPTVQDSGCSAVPTSAPSVNGTTSDKAVDLNWASVTGATSYSVFRTEGVFGCNFGKVKLGETAGNTWSDTGLQNGRQYSYVVIPTSSASCFGPASACTTVAPAAGPGLSIDTDSASSSFSGGDSDAYLDNCEDGTTTFDIINNDFGGLTNVHIVSVTPSNGGVTIDGTSVTPSSLSQGETAQGSFSYTAGGLSAGEDLTFTVEVTASEMASSKIAEITVSSTETDLQFVASRTYSFESDDEGWTTVQGTFIRSSDGGGSAGSWYEQSSAFLDNQCDQIQSPVMVFSATTTLSLSTNYDIEPIYQGTTWYDRANIGLDIGGSRTLVSPDSGRTYNASGSQGTCGTAGQGGWADAATTWGSSGFSAGALGSAGLAGQSVQLDVRYGTDPLINGYGFRFDEVTVTDVSILGADAQPESCGVPTSTTTTTTAASTTTTAAPTTTTTTTATTTTTLPGPDSVHVASVVTGTRNLGGGDKVGTATVTIVDNNGDPAAGYTVTGDFSGDIDEDAVTSTETTGSDGTVTVESTVTARRGVTVFFCVSDVRVGGLLYIPGDNAPGTTCVGGPTTTTSTTTTTAAPTTTTAAPTTTTTTAAPTTTTTTAAPTTTTTAAPTTTTTTAAPTTTTTTTTTSTTTTTLATGVHVGDLDGGTEVRPNGHWKAIVTITVFDESEAPVIGAAVNGLWSSGAGGTGACETDGSGQCSVDKKSVSPNEPSVTFTVVGVIDSGGSPYLPGDNHDPDGDSAGTEITVSSPF